jgi:hypothetical protein
MSLGRTASLMEDDTRLLTPANARKRLNYVLLKLIQRLPTPKRRLLVLTKKS